MRTRDAMTIGRLAKEAGVNVETIRYYQRRGLLDEPHRPIGGQRRYPPSAIARIGFIRRAQQFGFTLAEVQQLLAFEDGRNWKETRGIAEKKFDALTIHVKQLNLMRRALKGLIDKSRKRAGKGPCPIIEELTRA